VSTLTNLTLKIWRQDGPDAQGRFETHQIPEISDEASFLELLDILNERLIGDAAHALTLLISEDRAEAASLAASLDKLNTERRAIQDRVMEEAMEEAAVAAAAAGGDKCSERQELQILKNSQSEKIEELSRLLVELGASLCCCWLRVLR